VFKTLLTYPDAKPVLRDIISSILEISVVDVEVKNTALPISDIGEKRERLDVNCRIDGGLQADVEMQTEPMQGDSTAGSHANLKSRAIYYLCDLHASQEGWGLGYNKLIEGRNERSQEIAQNLLRTGVPADTIANVTGLTHAEIEKLR
jgi:hypothetical protein